MRRHALPLALGLSGFGALAVEVLWQRLLLHLIGGSTASLTAVLTAYMGGLALGAAAAGRWGDRLPARRALRAYVGLELAIALTAAATTLVLVALPAGLSGALAAVPEGAPRNLARVGFAAAILLLPTTAMGATLPLAVRAFVGAGERGLLHGAGLLYACNTGGAVLGTLVAPFVLMPAFGVFHGALVATTASLVAAAAALLAVPAAEVPAEEIEERLPAPRGLLPAIVLGAFATGGASLGFEILWTRTLTHHAGSSVHAFGAVLALVLGGITIGAAAASAERRIKDAATLAGLLMVLGPALAVALFFVQDQLPAVLVGFAQRGQLTLSGSLVALLGVGALAVLPPAICFGAALPLAIRVARASGGTAGSVGRIYVANTFGAILGAGTTGLFLLPWLGRQRAGLLLAAIAVAAGALVLSRAAPTRGRWLGLATIVLAVVVLIVAPREVNLAGATHERALTLGGTRLGLASITGNRPLYFAEGPEASVAVESDGLLRAFYVAGRPEASNGPRDMRTQYLLGHLPALLAGGARRSLVIGLGSGMTAGSLTVHGDVTIAELNQAVPGATRLFADLNHDVLGHARLRIEDGRVVLAEPGDPYDLITTDPIHPYIAGSALLYTREHFRHCRARLAPGGAVSLWLPLFTMGPGELRAIIGSFVDAFPDAELYLLSAGDALLVGGGRPRDAASTGALLRAGWTEAVHDDLRRALIDSPEELAALRVAGPAELQRLTDGARRNLDDDPWIELTLPRFKYVETATTNARALLALRAPATPLEGLHATMIEAYVLLRERQPEKALALLQAAPASSLEQRTVLRETAASLAAAHDDVEQARVEIAHPDATLRSVLTVSPLLERTQSWDALTALGERIQRQWPEHPEGPLVLAEILLAQGKYAEAIPGLEASLALDRYRSHAWRTLGLLGRTRLVVGRGGGVDALIESLSLRPLQDDVRALLASPTPALALQQLEALYADTHVTPRAEPH